MSSQKIELIFPPLINHLQLNRYLSNPIQVHTVRSSLGEIKQTNKQTKWKKFFPAGKSNKKLFSCLLLLKCKHISLLFAAFTNNECQLKVDSDDEKLESVKQLHFSVGF